MSHIKATNNPAIVSYGKILVMTVYRPKNYTENQKQFGYRDRQA